MKKVIASVLCLVLLFSLTGCSEKPAENADPVLVESNIPNNNEYVEEQENESANDLPQENIIILEPADDDFVRVKEYIPDLIVDLRYNTENNFTGEKIYDFSEAWLRYGTVKKLKDVQEALKREGKVLKIWDGFRPTEAQFKLWDVCPNPVFVANPETGFSSHSRGNTLDVTLVDLDGNDVIMPSGFDDFSALADRDYSDCSAEAAKNAILLEDTMVYCGFTPYKGEWWHYSDTEAYPVEQSFIPVEEFWCYAMCNEYISLRNDPDTESDVLMKIPANEKFVVHAKWEDFYYVEYLDTWGYVLLNYAKPVRS